MKSRALGWGLVALTALGCGLSFGDVSGVGDGGAPTATAPTTTTGTPPGTTTATTTTTTTTTTTGVDAAAPTDGGSDAPLVDAAGDARPPPTNVPARIVLRFEYSFPCSYIPLTNPRCVGNEGTFPERAVLHGATHEFLNAPGGAYGPNLNAGRVKIGGGPSGNAVDIDDATGAVPASPVSLLTVAAWVRRIPETGTDRTDIRLASLGPASGGAPLFELGYNKGSETSLALSVGEPLNLFAPSPSGRASTTRGFVLGDEWTFVAATYDASVPNGLCFYRGTEATEVTLVECVDYSGRSFTRAASRFSVGNASATSVRDAPAKVSFPGYVDNVFVYFGDALDLAELKKLQRD